MAGHEHNHSHGQQTSPADESSSQNEEDEFLKQHPGYLSKQSRRAFLASAGAAAALGTNYAVGFYRGDRSEVKAETLLAADTIRNAGNIHTLKPCVKRPIRC